MSEDKQIKRATQFAGLGKQQEAIQNEYSTLGGGKSEMTQNTIASKRQDVTTSKHQDAEEMKRQTVYMPMELATWLKIHAATTREDISGIITRLVERYRDEVEKSRGGNRG
jgi:hypothetical protein